MNIVFKSVTVHNLLCVLGSYAPIRFEVHANSSNFLKRKLVNMKLKMRVVAILREFNSHKDISVLERLFQFTQTGLLIIALHRCSSRWGTTYNSIVRETWHFQSIRLIQKECRYISEKGFFNLVLNVKNSTFNGSYPTDYRTPCQHSSQHAAWIPNAMFWVLAMSDFHKVKALLGLSRFYRKILQQARLYYGPGVEVATLRLRWSYSGDTEYATKDTR